LQPHVGLIDPQISLNAVTLAPRTQRTQYGRRNKLNKFTSTNDKLRPNDKCYATLTVRAIYPYNTNIELLSDRTSRTCRVNSLTLDPHHCRPNFRHPTEVLFRSDRHSRNAQPTCLTTEISRSLPLLSHHFPRKSRTKLEVSSSSTNGATRMSRSRISR